ncbi:MAG: 30S ribosomal protein S4e [Candidatus Micrarchaeota archaeon]
MALHGNRRHLKKLAKSRVLALPAKGNVWIKKVQPGAHGKDESIALQLFLRDIIRVARTTREAKMVLNAGEVKVDGRTVRDAGYGVGVMDVVSIPKMEKNYQVFMIKGRLMPVEVSADDAKLKSCRIKDKTILTGGKVQLNLHDGRNILIEKEEDRFNVGDTVRVKLPEYKIESFIKLEKGVNCYAFKGKHAGAVGTLEELIELPGGIPTDARIRHGDKEIVTHKDYLFAVAKEFHIN